MRLSTNTIFETSTGRISDLQSTLVKMQVQIQTGSRITTPSDDPVGTSKALGLGNARSANESLAANRSNARDPLQFSEGVLTSVSSLLESVQDVALTASTATTSDVDRKLMAAQLSSHLDQLIGLANTTDATGAPIFAGYRTGVDAFTRTPTGVQYNGDQGQRTIQVDNDRVLAVSESGDKIFQSKGNDVFATLTGLINLLQVPTDTPAAKEAMIAGVKAANVSITATKEVVLTARTGIGSRLKEIDSLDSIGADRDLYFERSLAEVQGLDYTKAVSNLAQQKTMLEASQQAFAITSKLSLFNYI